jgi:predicted DNA-binding transcriptional regulator AlpA
MADKKRLDAKDLSRAFQVDRATIYARLKRGELPTPKKVEGKMVWTLAGDRRR